jgi:hypothetical protein
MSDPKPDSNEQPDPPKTTPAPERQDDAPAHPGAHRHPHAVIHPANSAVTHLDPGGTVHI